MELFFISGTDWIASTSADMPLGCRMRRSAYAAAARHKAFLSSSSSPDFLTSHQINAEVTTEVFGLLFAIWWLRSWYVQHQKEKTRVRDLVNSALRLLRDQVRWGFILGAYTGARLIRNYTETSTSSRQG